MRTASVSDSILFMRRLTMLACLLLALPCAAADDSAVKTKTTAIALNPPLLPVAFAGWVQSNKPLESKDAAQADAQNAAVLKEFGFARLAAAEYARGDATLRLRAIEFADATGAYGAFTFYQRPEMHAEEIGAGGRFDGSHVLFWAGDTLVEASFDKLTPMSAAELRDLVKLLPQPAGGKGIAPTLAEYLPQQDLKKGSERYAIGPVAYAQAGGVLPPALVDFGRSAETVTAHYDSPEGDGWLTLIEYPTPQMAEEREHAIAGVLKAANGAQNWPAGLAQSAAAALTVQRSGPIVAMSAGGFNASEAQRLTGSVHYDAQLTFNHTNGYISEGSKAVRLYLGIFALVGILGAAAIIMGLFFGGGRALLRVLQGKPASTMHESEFIRLNLK